MNRVSISLIIIVQLFVVSLFAQLQSPDEFLPHNIGEEFTPHHMLVDYMYHVAESTSNVMISEYGRTNQGRPLLHLIISSQENIDNIEKIRLNNLFRAGIDGGVSYPEWDHVTVVWLSFSVHGNEPSGSEASMPVLYDLASGKKLQVKEWLKNTVVLMDPSINPDGYSRYTHWQRNVGEEIPNTNPLDREHNEPWPGGRVNHYMFDLNRDWAWQTQVESTQRMKVFNKWLPQVHVDFHEMFYNNPYYFAPAAAPYHEYITEWQGEFQHQIGRNHAQYFDKEGWLYFTREVFDLLYPSYGDTYPTFNGAIGMTYEQGGHSRAGRVIKMNSGELLKLSDRVAHHHTTALSTIEATSKNAGKVIQEFKNFYSRELPGKYQSYLVKGGNHHKAKALAALLDKQDINYDWVSGGYSGTGFSYRSGQQEKFQVENGDLLIQSNQPKKTLVQVLMDPEAILEDSLTYDITSWSLPYAYGVEVYATTSPINSAPLMEKTADIQEESECYYAIILDWNSLKSTQVIAQLHQKDITMRLATLPFGIEDKKFDRSSVIITKADNKEYAENLLEIVKSCGASNEDYQLVRTGFSEYGADLGSSKMELLKKPEVLVLSGDEVSANSFGQVWYYFEQVAGYPLTIIEASRLRRTNLDDFNVLILTDGWYGFGESELKKISDWVSAGGKLINIGYANNSFEGKDGFALSKYATDEAESEAKSEVEEQELLDRFHAYEGEDRRRIVNNVPGAIYNVTIDATHPMAYGIGDQYFTLKTSSLYFEPLIGAQNVGVIGKDARSVGFTGSEIKKKILGSVSFAVESKGSGKVVYMIDNPLYRGFWKEGQLLFSNAVFLVW